MHVWLTRRLRDEDLQCIFNTDEIVLIGKRLTCQNYFGYSEKPENLHGIKAINVKDLTIVNSSSEDKFSAFELRKSTLDDGEV